MPGTGCALLSEALPAVLEWVLCAREALLLPLPPPPSFITAKETCAPAELNFLQWLQMFEEFSIPVFLPPHPLFCWKFLPLVLLDVEVWLRLN